MGISVKLKNQGGDCEARAILPLFFSRNVKLPSDDYYLLCRRDH